MGAGRRINRRTQTCRSFIQAVYNSEMMEAKKVQRKCKELEHVALDAATASSKAFLNVKERAVELIQSDSKDQADELRAVKNPCQNMCTRRGRRRSLR